MQINITTDYAIRIALHLARTERVTTSVEIANEMQIPQNYVPNIAKKLRNSGVILATFGPLGGYRLARPAEDISLLEIIEVMEGPLRINRCLEDDAYCSRQATEYCKVHQVYLRVQNNMREILAAQTLDKLLEALN